MNIYIINLYIIMNPYIYNIIHTFTTPSLAPIPLDEIVKF